MIIFKSKMPSFLLRKKLVFNLLHLILANLAIVGCYFFFHEDVNSEFYYVFLILVFLYVRHFMLRKKRIVFSVAFIDESRVIEVSYVSLLKSNYSFKYSIDKMHFSRKYNFFERRYRLAIYFYMGKSFIAQIRHKDEHGWEEETLIDLFEFMQKNFPNHELIGKNTW